MPPCSLFVPYLETADLSWWAPLSALMALFAWPFRQRTGGRGLVRIRQAVENYNQLPDPDRMIEASRSRILEMLISDESQESVLDAITRAVRDQLPHAGCMVLVKEIPELNPANEVLVAAATAVPPGWLSVIGNQWNLPLEIWNKRCEFQKPETEAASFPATIRSVPIGEQGTSLGTILLTYREKAGDEPWERILCVAGRLVQIAIEHRRSPRLNSPDSVASDLRRLHTAISVPDRTPAAPVVISKVSVSA